MLNPPTWNVDGVQLVIFINSNQNQISSRINSHNHLQRQVVRQRPPPTKNYREEHLRWSTLAMTMFNLVTKSLVITSCDQIQPLNSARPTPMINFDNDLLWQPTLAITSRDQFRPPILKNSISDDSMKPHSTNVLAKTSSSDQL